MTKKRVFRSLAYLFLIALVLVGSVGCKKEEPKKEEPKKKVEKKKEEGELAKYQKQNIKFSLDLLKYTYALKQNSVLSPVSAQMTLAVAANGARGITQDRIHQKLGLENVVLNEYLKKYQDMAPNEKNGKLVFANSLWVNNITGNVEINSNFENRLKENLYANIELITFNRYTKDTVNTWIKEKTDGLIDTLYTNTEISDVLYFISVAGFSMDWEKSYNATDIVAGKFKNINGVENAVEMMSSNEALYLEDNNAVGFIKNYANPRFQFIALLPDETMTIGRYVGAMTADKMIAILENAKNETVKASIPKCVAEKTVSLRNAFTKMGYGDIYKSNSDFTGIMKNGNNIGIGKAYHKAVVEFGKVSSNVNGISTVSKIKTSEATREVSLNRPFMYMIYDSEQCVPVFIGIQQWVL